MIEINVFESKLGKSVYMTELYDVLGLDKAKYSRFVPINVLNNPFCMYGKDYLPTTANNAGKRGQFRTEYEIEMNFAIKLCMVSQSKKANEIRNFLVELLSQKQTGLLVTHEQVLAVVRMIKVFAVYEYRKKATDMNAENFKDKFVGNPNFVYAEFHKWRNEALNLGKEHLQARILDYCIAEGKALPKLKNKDSILNFLKEFEHIKNAVWDLLSSQNQSEEMIKNISNLAGELAHEMKPFLARLNETDLFFQKIENSEVAKVLNAKN